MFLLFLFIATIVTTYIGTFSKDFDEDDLGILTLAGVVLCILVVIFALI